MKIWILHTGEILPIDGPQRLLRAANFARVVAENGHDVIWWTATFSHEGKKHRALKNRDVRMAPNYVIRMIAAGGYRANVSLARLWHHTRLAYRFWRQAKTEPMPDIILTTLPTAEFCVAATSIGKRFGVPVVTDIRDMYPDTYLMAFPRWARRLVWPLFLPLRAMTNRALALSDAIFAPSNSYLLQGLGKAGRSRNELDAVIPIGYPEVVAPADAEVRKAEKALCDLGVDWSRLIVVYSGTFSRIIDLGTVIEAARALQDAGDERFQFVFAGHGVRASEWQNQAAGLKNIIFTGWLEASGIYTLLTKSWAGLAAYDIDATDAIGNKFYEYMSYGLPILSALGGDARKLLADREIGICYTPEAADTLVASLTDLADDSDRHTAWSRNALTTYEECYNQEDLSKQMALRLADIVSHFEVKD